MLSRRGLFASCAALLAALCGCTPELFNLNLMATGTRRETTLNGSLEVVSEATRKALADLKMEVASTRDADQVVLEGRTRAGHRFALFLRRDAADEEVTRIEVRWEREPDEAFWLDLLAVVGRVQFSRSGSR